VKRARRHAAEPPASVPRLRRAAFAPGDAVRVTDGLRKGSTGVVIARWPDIAGTPQWRVDFPDCRDRVIREDFLTREGAR
jgi:transcription elongation factor